MRGLSSLFPSEREREKMSAFVRSKPAFVSTENSREPKTKKAGERELSGLLISPGDYEQPRLSPQFKHL